MALACPHCKHPLTISQPPPERMACPHCQAVLRFAPAKIAKASVAPPVAAFAGGQASTATAKLVAGYELQRELARGGLGVVYLAYHPHLKQYRAIKRPQPRADIDHAVLLARFRREMEALGALDSKHIIRVYDAGADADGPYMVTEYLDGESLASLVARHRQLPVAEACEVIRQAALALQAAHECGLVHRDIKPSNLMLARATGGLARVTVIDWGLVKQMNVPDAPANRLTTIHTELGTPDYISPEQIRDARAVDIRADIYSLGVTLYFLLAGQPPFHGRPDEQKMLGHAKEPFPPLPRQDIPKPLMDVLVKMVRKYPAERFRTPAEVAAALQPFACAEPHRMLALLAPVPMGQTAPNDTNRILDEKTQIASPPSTPPAQTPAQSPRLLLWLAAAAGLLLVSGIGVLLLVIAVNLVFRGERSNAKKDKEEAGKKDGTKHGWLVPPPKGPVLADGPEGLLKTMPGGGITVFPLLFMPDGMRGVARYGGEARAWDLVDYVQRPALPWNINSGSTYGTMVVSPDGKRLAADDARTLVLFDGKYKKEDPPISLPEICYALAFSPDSKVLASSEYVGAKGRIRFWGANEREVAKKLIELDEPAISLSFSPDGQRLALSSGSRANLNIVNLGDKKIAIHRYDNGTLVRHLDGHPKAVCIVAYFADGKRLFSASAYDGTLRVWNVDEADKKNVGKEMNAPIQAGKSATNLTSLHDAKDPEFLTAVAFWPWGRALTAQQDGGLVLWDLDTGEKKRFKSPSGQTAYATSLAISPDGHHALAAYTDSKMYLFRLPPPTVGKSP